MSSSPSTAGPASTPSSHAGPAVEGEDGVDAALDDLDRRRRRRRRAMLLGERGVVGADPPRWREHERRAREVRLHAARAERLLARFEEPPEVRIGSGPGGAEDEALHAVGM